MTDNSYIVLASASPRRAEILKALGIPFVAVPAGIEETLRPGESPERAVSRLAAEKAAEVAARFPRDWVLAADTLVVVEKEILGKPRDGREAERMLRRLAGDEHRVVTAVRLRRDSHPGREILETSRVRVAPMTDEEIAWYVRSGEPRDKAGSYAVQGLGARFIERVEGSYTNVMGLPARGVYRLIAEAGDSGLALPVLSSP